MDPPLTIKIRNSSQNSQHLLIRDNILPSAFHHAVIRNPKPIHILKLNSIFARTTIYLSLRPFRNDYLPCNKTYRTRFADLLNPTSHFANICPQALSPVQLQHVHQVSVRLFCRGCRMSCAK